MSSKFELYEDSAGEWRFRLKAGNGEVVAVSEGYSSKAGAEHGIEAVARCATDAYLGNRIVEVKND